MESCSCFTFSQSSIVAEFISQTEVACQKSDYSTRIEISLGLANAGMCDDHNVF